MYKKKVEGIFFIIFEYCTVFANIVPLQTVSGINDY